MDFIDQVNQVIQRLEERYGVRGGYDYSIDNLMHNFAFAYKGYYVKVLDVPREVIADQSVLEEYLANPIEALIAKCDDPRKNHDL